MSIGVKNSLSYIFNKVWKTIKLNWRSAVIGGIILNVFLSLFSAFIFLPLEKSISPYLPWYNKPKLQIEVIKLPDYDNLLEGTSIKGIPWDNSKKTLHFLFRNNGSIEINNMEVIIYTDGIILDSDIVSEDGCFGCYIKTDYNKMFIANRSGRILEQSFCSTMLNLGELMPDGNYVGSIFIDRNTSGYPNINPNCNFKEKYTLKYSYSDGGSTRYEIKDGEIELIKWN